MDKHRFDLHANITLIYGPIVYGLIYGPVMGLTDQQGYQIYGQTSVSLIDRHKFDGSSACSVLAW